MVLQWGDLPEKTNETLRHHMQDERDPFFKENSIVFLIGSVLVTIVQTGDYDSRYRVLLRHICALLGVLWDHFEELEDTLSHRLVHDYIESDQKNSENVEESSSRTTREKTARMKKYKRYALIGAASGLGGALIGVTGGLAAPFVAGSIGALVGIPALTALAGTTGIIAAFGSVFGVAGGGLAGYRMKKRVGAIEEFVVEPLTDNKTPSLHCVLCVSGWIEDNDEKAFQRHWRHLWTSKEQYTLRYESKYLEEWGKAMEYFVSVAVGYGAQRLLMETVLAGVVSAIAWPLVLISSSSLIDNPWNVCFSRSVEVGEHLAEVLLTRAHGRRPITLIGFSLGHE
uniref:Transmembrane and coiled-coil domain-containing protein 4 n=1 Tax=Ditylenchus dipsaci TaxID=166011 RepID=A0A915DH25_9BILA